MIEYMKQVSSSTIEHVNLRYGQILFNTLYDMHPELAKSIRGTEYDPFYYTNGPKIKKYFEWLENQTEVI